MVEICIGGKVRTAIEFLQWYCGEVPYIMPLEMSSGPKLSTELKLRVLRQGGTGLEC